MIFSLFTYGDRVILLSVSLGSLILGLSVGIVIAFFAIRSSQKKTLEMAARIIAREQEREAHRTRSKTLCIRKELSFADRQKTLKKNEEDTL